MGIQILLALLTGLVSGLLTTLLVFVTSRYWQRVLMPWYENRLYQDIRIDGDWIGTGIEYGIPFTEIIRVHQTAHHVKGETTFKRGADIVDYEFEGEFKNLVLTVQYWAKRENNLDRGTFTLMLENNGEALRGHYVWYSPTDNCVQSGEYKWIRKSAAQFTALNNELQPTPQLHSSHTPSLKSS